jgi:hypothetical protein
MSSGLRHSARATMSSQASHCARCPARRPCRYLFTVIADLDPGSGLLGDDVPYRLPSKAGNRGGIDGFAFLPVGIERCQLASARQAAGVGGQDAVNALLHARGLMPRACIAAR